MCINGAHHMHVPPSHVKFDADKILGIWHIVGTLMSDGRFTGPDLWNRMSTSFGYFNKYGYGGHVFPIIIGESGSQYTDVRPDTHHVLEPPTMLSEICMSMSVLIIYDSVFIGDKTILCHIKSA